MRILMGATVCVPSRLQIAQLSRETEFLLDYFAWNDCHIYSELLKYPVMYKFFLDGFRSLEKLCLAFLDECVAVYQKAKRFFNACRFDDVRNATNNHSI
jgi:hypothetical protein